MRKSIRSAAKMPKRKKPKPRHVPALEWLSDISGTSARATVVGSRRVLIENHTGILEFGPERIRLSARRGQITVTGSDLTLSEVRPNAMIVLGRIDAVELPAEGGDHDA